MHNFFRDQTLNENLKTKGFVRMNILPESKILALREVYFTNKLSDESSYDRKNIPKPIAERKIFKIKNELLEILNKELTSLLTDHQIIRAFFIPKKSNVKSFIPPHQDSNCTEEKNGHFNYIICWIPLQATNIENGGIGFIEGSHVSYKGSSPPTPDIPTPKFLNDKMYELLPYMTVLDFKIGEAVFFYSKTFHGSLPNLSANERIAVRIDIVPKNIKLVNYYLKPNTGYSVMQKYVVDQNFFTKYPIQKLALLFKNQQTIPDYPVEEEEDYIIEDISMEAFIERIKENGYTCVPSKRIGNLIKQSNDESLPSKMNAKKSFLGKFLLKLKNS